MNDRRVLRRMTLAVCCLAIGACVTDGSALAQDAQKPGPDQLRKYLEEMRNAGEGFGSNTDASERDGFASDPDMLESDVSPRSGARSRAEVDEWNAERENEREGADVGSRKNKADGVNADGVNAAGDEANGDKEAIDDTGLDSPLDAIAQTPARLNTLELLDVVASVSQSYPAIIQSRQQTQLARGQVTEAWGSFDTKLKFDSTNEPTGFYENYRHSFGASRRTWGGGNVYGGYRIARGSFQPWYRERETDEGGEVKFGYQQSLMQGRDIDPARLAVYQASLKQKAVAPNVRLQLLNISRDASLQYWDWVEAGLVLQSQQSLVNLAEKRGKQYEAGVDAGKFPEIDLILNKQLIAERRAKLIESKQKFQASAFKLALYLRDQQGNPLVPDDDLLPNELPGIPDFSQPDLAYELTSAISRRPEVQLLELERKRLQNDHALASNQLQPMLDFVAEGSQDLGQRATSSDDKDQFLLILGLSGEVPVQRRKARGKLMAIHSKIAQLAQKQRLMQDKIQAELAIGFNELQRDAEVVDQAYRSLVAARETLTRYRFAFERGKIDLIYLNLLEVKANETEIKYLNAKKQWHVALARLRTSQGFDPSLQPN